MISVRRVDGLQGVAAPVDTAARRSGGSARMFVPGLPAISVIIVVRNGAATIRAAIDSVLRQDYPNLELVVVDGASEDGTLEILDSYADGIDRWVSERDAGIYDAMNKALTLVRGDWVLFLGCDDRLLAQFGRISRLLRNPSAIYYGNVWIPGRAVAYAGRFTAWTFLKRNICHQAILYPRTVFERRRFRTEYSVLADWELNLRCFADPGFRFEYIPELIAEYNGTTGHSALTRDTAFECDHSRIIAETLPRPVYYWHLLKTPLRIWRRRIGRARS